MDKILQWLLSALVIVVGSSAFAEESTCTPELETGGYVVGSVRLETPLSFVGIVQSRLLKVQSTLPVEKGKPLRCSDYEAGMDQLSARFGSGSVHPGELIRLAVVIPEIQPCKRCGEPNILQRLSKPHSSRWVWA